MKSENLLGIVETFVPIPRPHRDCTQIIGMIVLAGCAMTSAALDRDSGGRIQTCTKQVSAAIQSLDRRRD